MRKQNSTEKMLLKNSYIRQKGKVFPWGAFRLYANSVADYGIGGDYGGLWCWSENLLPYGSKKYRAELSAKEVLIYEKKAGAVVERIKTSELHVGPEVWETIVGKNGYLSTIGTPGLYSDPSRAGSNNPRYSTALEKAWNGIDPEVYDGSPFIRVSPSREGERLIEIALDFIDYKVDSHAIFTKDGQPVISYTDTPLAHKRWGAPLPQHDPSDINFEPIMIWD